MESSKKNGDIKNVRFGIDILKLVASETNEGTRVVRTIVRSKKHNLIYLHLMIVFWRLVMVSFLILTFHKDPTLVL